MKNARNFLTSLGMILLFILILAGCKDRDLRDIIDSLKGHKRDKIKIEVVSTGTFGHILVDQEKRTLYFFARDIAGNSACNGGCPGVWPPLFGKVRDLKISQHLAKDDFGAITREDGKSQITYKGWPLYYFAPEGDSIREAPGETLGDGRANLFYVAKPDYTVMLGQQPIEEGGDPVIYLVDDRGVTLYRFENDRENVSTCTEECIEEWPPLAGPDKVEVPSTLKADDFEIIDRPDSLGPQLAYLKSPLYYFKTDGKVRGKILGQGDDDFFVVELTF